MSERNQLEIELAEIRKVIAMQEGYIARCEHAGVPVSGKVMRSLERQRAIELRLSNLFVDACAGLQASPAAPPATEHHGPEVLT